MVKETKNFDQKGELSWHALPISGGSPKGAMGASWHWKFSINPQQVSAISHVRSPQNRRAGLNTRFVQGVSFIHTSTP